MNLGVIIRRWGIFPRREAIRRWKEFGTRIGTWRRAHPTGWIALCILLGFTVLFGPVLWGIGWGSLLAHSASHALKAYRAINNPIDKVEAYSKLAPALGLLLAAPLTFLGFTLAFWRTWNQHRDGELATRKLDIESLAATHKLDVESFAKAVEQLGHNEISIRLGAVLALELRGKASSSLLSPIIQVLCAYIREKRPNPVQRDDDSPARLPTDIQLILEIISRLKIKDKDNQITVDLHDTDLSGVSWFQATLNSANLSKAKLNRAKLNRADLSGADLRGADLSEANLIETNLRGADLRGAKLNGAKLNGADLRGADLSRAKLNGADLRGANLSSGADLSWAHLNEANLGEADLSRATLGGAHLNEADLSKVNLSKAYLNEAYLSKAYLNEADLSWANLRGADLIWADLSWANLIEANLVEADLSGANLNGANWDGADLDGADLKGTILDPARLSAL